MNESGLYSAAELFEKNRYVQVKRFIEAPLLNVAHRYVLMRAQNGQVAYSDKQVPGAPSVYADPLMESIMDLVTPHVEHLTGHKLFPTYSYFRLYKQGDVLRPHIDRPSCEISFSICLGCDVSNVPEAGYLWPIQVDNSRDYRRFDKESRRPAMPGEGISVLLEPGDCVIYRGCEVRHWRDAFAGNYQAQAFIHYVDQNGPYSKYMFDTRPMLGATADKITDTGPYKFFPDESA